MKILKLIPIIVIIFLIIGCQQENSSLQKNFKKGHGELSLSFILNNPPEKIYPDSEFNMIAKVSNKASYDVNNGIIRISGLDEKYFDIHPKEQTFEVLKGINNLNFKGEETYVEFSGKTKNLFENSEKYVGDYFLETFYSSSMQFVDTVCINPNLYDTLNLGCKIDNKKSYSGQGSPLEISQLEEIIYPGFNSRVEFRMKLRNRGKGKLITASLIRAKLSSEPLDCRFKGLSSDKRKKVFDSKDQETILICTKSIEDSNSFSTTLLLDFVYDYKLIDKKRLVMVR